VLDFSKMEAGHMTLDPAPFSLSSLAGRTLRSLALRAAQKGLELTHEIDPTLPDTLTGDALRLRQVLTNLLSNAIKFTHAGEVVLNIRPTAEGLVHFTVRDTGIGIPASKQELIFESFAQADASTTRQFGGTGLGLSICRRLIELMGGRIWVVSEPGQGSSFHFTAQLPPAAVPVPPAGPVVDAGPLAGRRVLLVDDNPTNLEILARTLEHWQMRPHCASSATTALLALEEAHLLKQSYDLAITDGHMPQEDGFELARQIRLSPQFARLPVVMLTSGGDPADALRCRAMGLSAYLTKPVLRGELLEAITAALGLQTELEPQAAEPEEPVSTAPGLRILLAEDNQVNQLLACRLLERLGHAVTVVNDGAQAVERMRSSAYDLVFMDVQMPVLDGLQATAQIRALAGAAATVPIVALTAHTMAGDRERFLAAGMDAYLSKPIRSAELVNLLAQLTVPSGPDGSPDC